MNGGAAANQDADRYGPARLMLSRIAHPVAIVGAAHGSERSCATGTTMYVSLAPPMLAIAEHPGSRTTRLIRASGEFSISLLSDSQQALAAAAGKSAKGPDKFAALNIPAVDPPKELTAPGVAGSIAILWCRVVRSEATGDHLVFVGEVVAHHVDDDRGMPLLRYGRRYMRSGAWASDESPEGYPI
jgi:flavin reductase (DIM6/NTAB) family NADH-FMN oxidoreductase RutF